MKFVFSVLTVFINFLQVMTINRTPDRFIGNVNNIFGNDFWEVAESHDNPNYKQSLMSETFITSSNDLFNNDAQYKQLNYSNNNVYFKTQEEQYNPLLLQNSGSKQKGDNVGYYSMENTNNDDVDLERRNIVPHSLIDSYNNNKFNKKTMMGIYRRRLPVQCMKTSPLQLFCVHGDVIYKLKLPRNDLTEDEIGKLIETVYSEIEVKRKPSFILDRIYKRELKFDKENLIFPPLTFIDNQKIMRFSLPSVSDTNLLGENNDFKENTLKSLDKEQINVVNHLKEVNEPPAEFLNPHEGKIYSSKWFSKRNIRNVKENVEKRRVILPSCPHRRPTERRCSINEGKTGKCHLTKGGQHKCFTRAPCACSHEWTTPPKQTTCPSLPPLLPNPIPTRCPAYSITEECPNYFKKTIESTVHQTTVTITTIEEEPSTSEDVCPEAVEDLEMERKHKKARKRLRLRRIHKRRKIK